MLTQAFDEMVPGDTMVVKELEIPVRTTLLTGQMREKKSALHVHVVCEQE